MFARSPPLCKALNRLVARDEGGAAIVTALNADGEERRR
jgi:hypothetical protein